MALPLGIFRGYTVPDLLRRAVTVSDLRSSCSPHDTEVLHQAEPTTDLNASQLPRRRHSKLTKLFSLTRLRRRIASCKRTFTRKRLGQQINEEGLVQDNGDMFRTPLDTTLGAADEIVGIDITSMMQQKDQEVVEDVLQADGSWGPPRKLRDDILGVKVNPPSIMRAENRNKYEVVMIKYDPNSQNAEAPSLTAKLGLGLWMFLEQNSVQIRTLDDLNEDGQAVCIEVSYTADDYRGLQGDTFGTTEPDMYGAMHFARLDRQPLHTLHLAAMIAFVHENLHDDFAQYRENLLVWRNLPAHFQWQHEALSERNRIGKKITPQLFREFWNEYKQVALKPHYTWLVGENGGMALTAEQMEQFGVTKEDLVGRPDWQGVPCPYDVGKTRRMLQDEEETRDAARL